MVSMILIGAALFVAACMAVVALGMLVFGDCCRHSGKNGRQRLKERKVVTWKH